jgi:hypothetical protein
VLADRPYPQQRPGQPQGPGSSRRAGSTGPIASAQGRSPGPTARTHRSRTRR